MDSKQQLYLWLGQLWELSSLRGRSADRQACQQSAANLSDSSNEQFIADETVSA